MNNIASARMQSIISDGQQQIPKVLEQINTEWDSRKDMIIKHTGIKIQRKTMNYGNGPLEVSIGENDGIYGLTDHSASQMFAHYEIPRAYAEKLREWNMIDLLETNFQKIGSDHLGGESVMLRTVSNTIKGWLSPSYKRMDASPIIGTFVEENIKNGLVPIRAFNTDSRVQLRFAYPDVIMPQNLERESCLFGVSCTTSDYGGSAYKIEVFILRLVCLNGMLGSQLWRKVHLGSRFSSEDSIAYLSKDTQALDVRTLQSATRDIIKLLPAAKDQVLAKIEKAFMLQPNSATWAEIKRNTNKETFDAISHSYKTNMDVDLLPPEQSNWRLANTISLIAQQQTNEDKRIDLENMAAKYIA